MYFWYLKREWLDQEDGIDAVYLHYTWTPYSTGPDWNQHRETRLLEKGATIKEGMGGTVLAEGATDAAVKERPSSSPENARVRVIKMPSRIWDPHRNGWTENYLSHHYFEVHQKGRVWNTDLFTEEIVSRDLEYVDWAGNLSGTCAHWSVFDFDAAQYTPAEIPEFIDRYGDDNEFRCYKFYHYPDRSHFLRQKKLMTQEIPLPHRWRATVRGPRGAKVVQGWHVGFLDEMPPAWEPVTMREEWTGYGSFVL